MTAIDFVPDWAKGIVWYQIFPDRFWNGDLSNDPRLQAVPLWGRILLAG
jgi:hypothetical protein